MTHIVAGYPTMKKCEGLALLMAREGVSFIEIQIPFSDPVADGPVIMEANKTALLQGVTVADCFNLMKRIRKKTSTPLLFMTYFNILHHYGVERFVRHAKACGCYGLIVPDMPIDEESGENYLAFCKKYGVRAIQIVSPLTPGRRLKMVTRSAGGFVYCVARYGTTGTGDVDARGLGEYLKKVREYTNLPLAVRFGISKKEDVAVVQKYADIPVIGSKILQILEEEGLPAVRLFLRSILSRHKKPKTAQRKHSAKRKSNPLPDS